ncbi:hypothetical protein BABINDRAFT_160590 [Babjeviella inositovora NRRL Y-12698]|uniref:Dynein light chain n=1 Tax=Babjeviella inositovora NRRL Y-12698 TaxID=984486 RepID=A0A1E3QU55_9ASCO|nr:uncharacterized protein BABINDRAFT_160590 [Babjeviella inositovora NRRL Y-12698]ODQ81199.1 hypothetical protein BABINDRAFT_160590 [Babjeviella inositovora NRRL Y-12698]
MSLAKDATPVLKAADMPEELQYNVFELAGKFSQEHQLEKDIAQLLKKALDEEYGHTWHVIVGNSFGSYVTHEMGFFVYFYIGPKAFLCYKSG